MQWNLFTSLLLAAVAGLITYVSTRIYANSQLASLTCDLNEAKTANSVAQADFTARHEELRKILLESASREQEIKDRLAETLRILDQTNGELKHTLEEKGRFQNEATRIDEVKIAIAASEAKVQLLNGQISNLNRERTEALKDAEAAETRAIVLVAKEREAQGEVVKAKDELILKLSEFIKNAREVLSMEFKALSADALRDVTARLVTTADGIIEVHAKKTTSDVKLHHEQIQTMLKPVEETIKRLDKSVEESNLARGKAEALLDEQVKRLAGASESLTNALRKPVVRGSWGEMTLENALENAGLEAEIDFILQHSTDGEDGRKRTDAIINLPKGRKLIIDSKNLMESYIVLANSEDETQKAFYADLHSKSLKSHIKALSGKEYWQRYEGLDCVILFIPHDGMYHSAVKDEAELIREACEKRVFIANPMSLIPLLKAIRYVLDQDRLNKSAKEISNVGVELYGDITRFADKMSTIGSRLKSTVNAYNDAIPGLDRFIVAKSRKLKQLGAWKGGDGELPEAIDIDPKLFSSGELRPANANLLRGDSLLIPTIIGQTENVAESSAPGV